MPSKALLISISIRQIEVYSIAVSGVINPHFLYNGLIPIFGNQPGF